MSFTIKDPRLVVYTGDHLHADESVEAGHNGRFDARLIKRKAGRWDIEIFMKLQFFFKDGSAEDFKEVKKPGSHKWSSPERERFMRDWHMTIRSYWNRQNVGILLADRKPVNVTFNFHIQEGGWMWDHFEVDVTKANSHYKAIGSVMLNPVEGDVQLSSKSVEPVTKESTYKILGVKCGYMTAIHEFGHMIGLGEEYKDSLFTADKKSVMHSGPYVRDRHYGLLLSWASAKLRGKYAFRDRRRR